MVASSSKAWSRQVVVLVWPGIVLASLTIYQVLIHSLGLSYEVALQVHFLILMLGIFALELVAPYHKRWNTYDRQGWNDFLYNLTFPAAQIGAVMVALWITKQQ